MSIISGTFGLEYCSPGTSCAKSSVCNRGCHSNIFWMAYPHFKECDSHYCEDKTSLPYATSEHCHPYGSLYMKKCGHDLYLEAALQECGPSRANATAQVCQAGTTAKAIACANSALFHSICGCNPLTYGIGWTKVSVF